MLQFCCHLEWRYGRAFAFAPLYKFVSTLVAKIVRVPFDMDKSDRSVTTLASYLGWQSAIERYRFYIGAHRCCALCSPSGIATVIYDAHWAAVKILRTDVQKP